MNALKPRSRVIPRSFDYALLSNPAVEAMVLKALQRLVFPESICPKTPMLMFRILEGISLESELSCLTNGSRLSF